MGGGASQGSCSYNSIATRRDEFTVYPARKEQRHELSNETTKPSTCDVRAGGEKGRSQDTQSGHWTDKWGRVKIQTVDGAEKERGRETLLIEDSLTHLLTHSLNHSLTHSLNHSLTQSLTHSLTQSLTHSITHSFTHSLTHSLTHSPMTKIGKKTPLGIGRATDMATKINCKEKVVLR